MNQSDFELLIDYSFNNQELFEIAIQHKSFNKAINNERLEFLGDSILNAVIAEYLYLNYPNFQEGRLTRARASLVKGNFLTDKANEIQLEKLIKLSKGMENLSDDRKFSLLEGAFEALIGAVFIDGGWDNVKQVIYKVYKDDFKNLMQDDDFKDSKSLLQEKMQAKGMSPPVYKTIELADKKFQSSVNINDVEYCADGKTKKSAEANVAKIIVEKESLNR